MEELMLFLNTYGWQLSLIAFLGIVVLGVLKYTNAFKNIEKEKRKILYLAVTVGFSIVATVIYLLIIKQFTIEYLITITVAIYALNQTFYTIYENTSLRDLMMKLLDIIKEQLNKKQNTGGQ